MISSVIRKLCAMSILCGAAMSIAPEGTVKRVMEIVCSVVIISAVVQPFIGVDFTAYALELARFEEREAEFLADNSELNNRLNRLVIEERYEAYIMDKARELNTEVFDADVTAQWNMDGYWIPYSVQINCDSTEGQKELSERIEAELGIPAERQQWRFDGTTAGYNS